MIEGLFEVFVLWVILTHLVGEGSADQVSKNNLEGDFIVVIITSATAEAFAVFFALPQRSDLLIGSFDLYLLGVSWHLTVLKLNLRLSTSHSWSVTESIRASQDLALHVL